MTEMSHRKNSVCGCCWQSVHFYHCSPARGSHWLLYLQLLTLSIRGMYDWRFSNCFSTLLCRRKHFLPSHLDTTSNFLPSHPDTTSSNVLSRASREVKTDRWKNIAVGYFRNFQRLFVILISLVSILLLGLEHLLEVSILVLDSWTRFLFWPQLPPVICTKNPTGECLWKKHWRTGTMRKIELFPVEFTLTTIISTRKQQRSSSNFQYLLIPLKLPDGGYFAGSEFASLNVF